VMTAFTLGADQETQLAVWRQVKEQSYVAPYTVKRLLTKTAVPADSALLQASRTLFNLVPCNRELEVAVSNFLDRAADVVAFAKNAGPQSLRIDYLALGSRLSFYTPDFFVRSEQGHCYLVETKGREDKEVPRKAKAAIACARPLRRQTAAGNTSTSPKACSSASPAIPSARSRGPVSPPSRPSSTAKSDQLPFFAAAARAEAAEDDKAPQLKGIVDDAILQVLLPATARRSSRPPCFSGFSRTRRA
jgi:type III restriction enzyme